MFFLSSHRHQDSILQRFLQAKTINKIIKVEDSFQPSLLVIDRPLSCY